jgi:UDP-glucose 4-epimerase
MTVLVTGSAGHLGEATIRTLRARGSPARGINLKPSPYTDATGSIVDPTFKTDGGKSVRAVLS